MTTKICEVCGIEKDIYDDFRLLRHIPRVPLEKLLSDNYVEPSPVIDDVCVECRKLGKRKPQKPKPAKLPKPPKPAKLPKPPKPSKPHQTPEEWRQSPTGRWCTFLSRSKRREIAVEITSQDYFALWDEPCFYCGEARDAHGIDRVNSDLCYTISNIVPCCTRCNLMKGTLTQDEFIAAMSKILINIARKVKKD